MKKYNSFLYISLLTVILTACSQSTGGDSKELATKKSQLDKLRKEYEAQGESIKKLEAEIALLDTNAVNNANAKLVALSPVKQSDFKHFIELQGLIEAENVSYIAPRGMGGLVKAVYVKQGQQVKKGQLLLKLDDAIMQQQVATAKQQLGGIQTQLNYAREIFKRQQNLWNQGVGTEVQLINARTNVEGLEFQYKAAQEQVKLAQEQASTANVYSDVDGIADIVNIRVGETFVGNSAAGPQIKIVNTSALKAVANVPENYVDRVKAGAKVQIFIPDANKTIESAITVISPSIDLISRGFIAEAKIQRDNTLKANQTIVMKILDYDAPNAITVPVNLLQTDDNGKYILVAEKKDDKLIVKKKSVVIGKAYGENIEIVSGLTAGEQMISQGYQNLYDGQVVVVNQ